MSANLGIEVLDQDFADKNCYGCPCFRHDWLVGAIYCRRKLDKLLCEKIDWMEQEREATGGKGS